MKNILLLILTLLFTQQSKAQFLKKIKSKIKEKVEEAVYKKVQKENDDNHPEEYEYEQENKSSKNDNTVYEDVKPNSNDIYSEVDFKDRFYDFDTKITYSIKNNLSDVGLKIFNYYNSKDTSYFATESQVQITAKTFKIYDGDLVVSLQDSKGIQFKDVYKGYENDDLDLSFKTGKVLKATGKVKSVLGFKCKEYELENRDGRKSSYWITDSMKIKDFRLKKGNTNGILLEAIHETKQYTVVLKVTAIDKDFHKKINTENYKEMVNMSASEMQKIYGR